MTSPNLNLKFLSNKEEKKFLFFFVFIVLILFTLFIALNVIQNQIYEDNNSIEKCRVSLVNCVVTDIIGQIKYMKTFAKSENKECISVWENNIEIEQCIIRSEK